MKYLKKYGILLLAIGALVFGGYLLVKQSSKPLPGQAVSDQGREHVPDGTKVEYNSNPPTSGAHFADWTRWGVLSKPVSDGHLVHSLEHGYVILSYNCNSKISNDQFSIFNVLAHEEELLPPASPSTENNEETPQDPNAEPMGSEWESAECKDLVAKLSAIYEKKGKKKIIVIPRPNLDAKIALTAWGRIDKLESFDEERIVKFIDAFLNRGPEQTME